MVLGDRLVAGNAVLAVQVVVLVVDAVNTARLDMDSCNLVTRLEGLEIILILTSEIRIMAKSNSSTRVSSVIIVAYLDISRP